MDNNHTNNNQTGVQDQQDVVQMGVQDQQGVVQTGVQSQQDVVQTGVQSQQDVVQTSKKTMHLPFNGDAKNFHVNIPNMEIAPMQPMVQEQPARTAKPKRLGLIIAILSVVILVAGGVLSYLMLLTPEKRFDRAMKKADTAFENEEYDTAISNYRKALKINEDEIAAMYGVLMAEQSIGDIEAQTKDYYDFRSKIILLDDETINQNMTEVVEIFLMSQSLFEDVDVVIEEIGIGLSCVEGNEELLSAFVSAKLDKAKAEEEVDKEFALALYYEALGLQANEEAVEAFTGCWKSLVDDYLSSYAYEPAQKLLDVYNGAVDTINFTDYQSKINYAKTVAEQGIPLMQKAYDAMATGDYYQMCEIDLSEERVQFLDYVNDSFIWAPDGFDENYTGTAIGLYKHKESMSNVVNYFYYGEYENGVRSGQGICFFAVNLDPCEYDMFDGMWANDKPNGYGISGEYNYPYEDEGSFIDTIISGNYIDGYADGEMQASITSSLGYTVKGTFTASMGEVTDISEQYQGYNLVPEEGRKIYAVLVNEEHVWWLSSANDSKLRAASWIEE